MTSVLRLSSRKRVGELAFKISRTDGCGILECNDERAEGACDTEATPLGLDSRPPVLRLARFNSRGFAMHG